MGQGTDSCGGWDFEYDEYEEGLEYGYWIMQDGRTINVTDMSSSHIKNCIILCERQAYNSTFEDEEEKWNNWIDIFNGELDSRVDTVDRSIKSPMKTEKKTKKTRGSKVNLKCHCGALYSAREAHFKRGWGLSCSKSCAAKRRTNRLSGATIV